MNQQNWNAAAAKVAGLYALATFGKKGQKDWESAGKALVGPLSVANGIEQGDLPTTKALGGAYKGLKEAQAKLVKIGLLWGGVDLSSGDMGSSNNSPWGYNQWLAVTLTWSLSLKVGGVLDTAKSAVAQAQAFDDWATVAPAGAGSVFQQNWNAAAAEVAALYVLASFAKKGQKDWESAAKALVGPLTVARGIEQGYPPTTKALGGAYAGLKEAQAKLVKIGLLYGEVDLSSGDLGWDPSTWKPGEGVTSSYAQWQAVTLTWTLSVEVGAALDSAKYAVEQAQAVDDWTIVVPPGPEDVPIGWLPFFTQIPQTPEAPEEVPLGGLTVLNIAELPSWATPEAPDDNEDTVSITDALVNIAEAEGASDEEVSYLEALGEVAEDQVKGAIGAAADAGLGKVGAKLYAGAMQGIGTAAAILAAAEGGASILFSVHALPVAVAQAKGAVAMLGDIVQAYGSALKGNAKVLVTEAQTEAATLQGQAEVALAQVKAQYDQVAKDAPNASVIVKTKTDIVVPEDVPLYKEPDGSVQPPPVLPPPGDNGDAKEDKTKLTKAIALPLGVAAFALLKLFG